MQAGQLAETESSPDRYILNIPENGLTEEDLAENQYLLFEADYFYRNLDKDFMPTHGIEVYGSVGHYINVKGKASDFSKIKSSISAYYSLNKYPRTVFAFRVGGEKNFGDYPFYEAAKLGGNSNLRGFRKTRFLWGMKACI